MYRRGRGRPLGAECSAPGRRRNMRPARNTFILGSLRRIRSRPTVLPGRNIQDEQEPATSCPSFGASTVLRPARSHRGPAAQLAAKIRETIIGTVANTGGHLGSSLGVVELTLALHRLLESPRDRIVWDAGHRAVPPQAADRPPQPFRRSARWTASVGFRDAAIDHDVFDGGHAGTGLSIAEGLAEARDVRHGLERVRSSSVTRR